MPKKRIFILSSLSLILSLGVLLPWGIGKTTENYIQNMVEKKNKDFTQVKLLVKNYTRGIFSSRAQIEIRVVSKNNPLHSEFVVIDEQTILHGPIILDLAKKSIDFARVKINSQLRLIDSETIRFDLKNISGVSYLPFKGDMRSYFSAHKISGLIHSSNIQFEVHNLKSTIGLDNSNFSIENFTLRMMGKNAECSMNHIQLKDKVTATKVEGEMTLEAVEAYIESKKIQVKGLAWNFVIEDDKTHINLQSDAAFHRAEYNGQIYGPLELDFAINRFPSDLMHSFEKINQSTMDKKQRTVAIQNEIEYRDLNFDIILNKIKLKIPGGDFYIAGKGNLLSELKDNIRNYDCSKGNLLVKISKKALNEQLLNLFSTLNNGKVQHTSEALINQLMQTGGLVDTGNHYESYFIVKNNHFFMNGSLGAGILSKKLSCEINRAIPEHELLIAIWSDDAEHAQSLLQKGINKDFDYKDMKNPLIEAAALGNKTIVDALLQYGFQVNQADYDNNTALYWACRSGEQDIVKILLDKGANPNIMNHLGWTPLQEAAENGFKPIVELLIAKHAEINKVDADGRSALFWAATNNHSDIIQLLMEKGADPSLKNSRGMSALDIAKERNHLNTVNVLEKI